MNIDIYLGRPKFTWDDFLTWYVTYTYSQLQFSTSVELQTDNVCLSVCLSVCVCVRITLGQRAVAIYCSIS